MTPDNMQTQQTIVEVAAELGVKRVLNNVKGEIQKEVDEERLEMEMKIMQGGLDPNVKDSKGSALA